MSDYNQRLRNVREHDACGIGAVVHIDGKADNKVVDQALTIVEKLEHRAGKDASGEVGDGVGILLQISHRFFKKAVQSLPINLPQPHHYAVGMFFFPQDTQQQAMKTFENMTKKNQLKFLGWRKVPCQEDILGQKAKECMPCIMQCFIEKNNNQKKMDFERILYLVRREFEKTCSRSYVVSLSSSTIVYKGMFLVQQLRQFYLDLQDSDYQSAIAIVHSRFSTNTNPSWQKAHPHRMIAHNGEINTIRGNAKRMLVREETLHSAYFHLSNI